MEFSLIINSIPSLLRGTVLTIQMLVMSLLLGMCLAIPLAILRVQKNPLLWMPAHWYIYFFRGTPLLVQLFLVYYGLAQLEFVRESVLWLVLRRPFGCAILTFILCTAGYTANILRGGIEGVPYGEVEAARAIGMSTALLYRRILLPRAFRLALPAYSNEVIGMLKATSLASTITILELTGIARVVVDKTFAPYELFVAAAMIYLSITFVITRLFNKLEYSLNPHMRPPPERKTGE